MENIFLLLMSLITGFEASAGIKGCPRDSTELNCTSPNRNQYSVTMEIPISTINHEQNNYIDVCEERISFPLFQYIQKEKLSLTVRQFQRPKPQNPKNIEIVAGGCDQSSNKGYMPIRCVYPTHNQSKIKFFCIFREFICEKLSTRSFQDSNRAFILTEHRHKMPSDNDGVYSCQMKAKETEKNHGGLILNVTDITTFTKSPTIGENFTYFCKSNVNHRDIFICKGEDPTYCQDVVNTKTALRNQRFTMKSGKNKSHIITVREVTASDSGTYWCGTEKPDNSRIFMHRFFLNVVTTSTSPAISTASSSVFVATSMSPAPLTAATSATGGLGLAVTTSIIIGGVGLVLLLLVIVTFSLYKRCVCSEKSGDRSSEHPNEDCIYEEIPDGQQTTVTSVYVTATFPTNDPASLHYSTHSFPTIYTEKVNGEALVVKPSTPSCQYSVLKCSQCSTSLNDPPNRSTDEPLYSAVKKPNLKTR